MSDLRMIQLANKPFASDGNLDYKILEAWMYRQAGMSDWFKMLPLLIALTGWPKEQVMAEPQQAIQEAKLRIVGFLDSPNALMSSGSKSFEHLEDWATWMDFSEWYDNQYWRGKIPPEKQAVQKIYDFVLQTMSKENPTLYNMIMKTDNKNEILLELAQKIKQGLESYTYGIGKKLG